MQSLANLEQAILANLRQLPPEKQQEVLDFAEFLRQKTALNQPSRTLKGLWTNLETDISEENIAEARQEMWGIFPREFPE